MKKLVNVTEVEGEGLEALMGEKVILLCANYFYTGTLVGVNTTCVCLEDPSVVFDAGRWSDKGYAEAEKMVQKTLYVQCHMIEAFGVSK